MALTAEFANWSAGLRWTDIPAPARHHAQRCVLDWLGCTIAGGVLPVTRALRAALDEELPPPDTPMPSTPLIPDGQPVPARVAALINGTAAHAAEFDDIYAPGLFHTGCPTISAAHAVGMTSHCSGADFLLAVIAGYEVSNRIARTVNPSHYDHWHTTGTVGVFGATAAASRLLGLDTAQTGHALGTAATCAAGLRGGFGGDTKPLHSGRAAEAGVLAAQAARAGFLAPPDMLEGAAGFGAATSHTPDWSMATAGLGTEFTIERMTVKQHGCCGHAFAALDALSMLQEAHGFAAEDVTGLTVATYAKAVEILSDPEPNTANAARFSLPFCAATMLRFASVALPHFTPERLADPTTLDLARRVQLTVDDGFEAAFPARRGAKVQVLLKDGRRLEERVPDRHGSPEAPLSDEALTAKFHTLADPVLGPARAGALASALWALDDAGDLRKVFGA